MQQARHRQAMTHNNAPDDPTDVKPAPPDLEEKLTRMERRVPGLFARRAALDLLGLIRRKVPLDQSLQMCPSFLALDGSDKSFAHNIAATSLRNRGRLDGVIGHFLDRPLPAKNAGVMDILRITATQLLFLKTPPHAAVSTATELAYLKRETAGYKGLVNAVARRIAEQGPTLLGKEPFRADTPGWLWRQWERQYGPALTKKIALANRTQAALDLTLKPEADKSRLLEIPGAQELPTGTIRLDPGHRVVELPGFAEGDWWVQDFAASLPVKLAGPVSGRRVYDLCAAPGGKTMQLAAADAKVTAVDNSEKRLERLRANLTRTGLMADIVQEDILHWQPEEQADLILLDAPCSATGTIRRHPDIPWIRTENDVADLTRLQAAMIDKALSLLKPTGRLVYCTCSLQRPEGEDQASAALKRHEYIALVEMGASAQGLPEGFIRHNMLRTLPTYLPDQGGLDGFFACIFEKSQT